MLLIERQANERKSFADGISSFPQKEQTTALARYTLLFLVFSCTVQKTKSSAENYLTVFCRAAQRRRGCVFILFNVWHYGRRLAFQAFMVQERPYGFKALNVTLKILVQNPGLLRFSSW